MKTVKSLCLLLMLLAAAGCDREKPRGVKPVRLLRFTRAMRPGQLVRRQDIRVVSVPAKAAPRLGRVVRANQINRVIGRTTSREILPDQWINWADLSSDRPARARAAPPVVTVQVELAVDPRMGSVSLLRRGNRVNVLGAFAVGSQPTRTYRIISAVPVRSITHAGQPAMGEDPRPRRITVAVPQPAAEKLRRILPLARGPLWVELLAGGYPDPPRAGRINPELLKLLAAPATQPATTRP